MTNLIKRLHEKPDHHRKAVALGVSFIITLMIFGIWASTLPEKISGVSGVAKETQKQLEDGITPLATVKASFDEAAKSLGDLKNVIGQ